MKRLILILFILIFVNSFLFADIQQGINLFNRGAYDKAIELLVPFANQKTNDKRVYYTLFLIYYSKWDLNNAIKYGVEYLKYGSDFDIVYRMTMAYYQLSKWRNVVLMAQFSNSQFGDNHEIYNLMGMAYYFNGNYDLAEIALRTANTLFPNHHIYRNNFGMSLEKIGKLQDALAQYKRSIQLNPRYAKAIANVERLSKILAQNPPR